MLRPGAKAEAFISPRDKGVTMKTLHSRLPTVLAGAFALALSTAGVFAATAPADPDPTSKGIPMEDTAVPKSQATTPYSDTSSTTSKSTSEKGSSSQMISMQSKFDSLDINHDGYIDLQEASADSKLSKQFSKLDANKDNKLSVTEFANAKGLAMNKKPAASKSSSKDLDSQ
jgi:hypothetical protein